MDARSTWWTETKAGGVRGKGMNAELDYEKSMSRRYISRSRRLAEERNEERSITDVDGFSPRIKRRGSLGKLPRCFLYTERALPC